MYALASSLSPDRTPPFLSPEMEIIVRGLARLSWRTMARFETKTNRNEYRRTDVLCSARFEKVAFSMQPLRVNNLMESDSRSWRISIVCASERAALFRQQEKPRLMAAREVSSARPTASGFRFILGIRRLNWLGRRPLINTGRSKLIQYVRLSLDCSVDLVPWTAVYSFVSVHFKWVHPLSGSVIHFHLFECSLPELMILH